MIFFGFIVLLIFFNLPKERVEITKEKNRKEIDHSKLSRKNIGQQNRRLSDKELAGYMIDLIEENSGQNEYQIWYDSGDTWYVFTINTPEGIMSLTVDYGRGKPAYRYDVAGIPTDSLEEMFIFDIMPDGKRTQIKF